MCDTRLDAALTPPASRTHHQRGVGHVTVHIRSGTACAVQTDAAEHSSWITVFDATGFENVVFEFSDVVCCFAQKYAILIKFS